MKKVNIKPIIKYAGNLITLLSVIFIIKVAISFDIDFSVIQNRAMFTIVFFTGIVAMCTTVFIIAYGWTIVLSVLSQKKVKYGDAAAIYAKANMGKYLPGNVMHYVERNLFASNLGLDQKSVLLSTLTEIIGLISVCIIISLVTVRSQIINILEVVVEWKYLFFISVLLILVIICAIIFRKKIKKFLSDIPWLQFFKVFIKAIPTYFVFVVIGGAVLVSVFRTVDITNMTPSIALQLIFAYTTAWVIGFVVPGSPGGIGVREFILLFLLRESFPENTILTCILVHRFISVLGDIMAYLVTLLWKKQYIITKKTEEKKK